MAATTSGTRGGYRAWHGETQANAGMALVSTVNALARDQKYRPEITKARLGTYLGRTVQNLTADLYYQRDQTTSSIYQSYAMPVCDTAQANIAAKQRPKPQALTKGGDYYLQLEAEKASKFLEGCVWASQDGYANTWDLAEHVFHDSTWHEAGVIHVRWEKGRATPVHERCFAHDFYVDPLDARTGSPRMLTHAAIFSKSHLIDLYPHRAKQIEKAGVAEFNAADVVYGDKADFCTLYRGWARGKRVVYAVDNGLALHDEKWEHSRFPFVFIRWQRNAFGFWGAPPVDQIRVTQEKANEILQAIVENTQQNAGGYVEYAAGAYDEAALTSALPQKLVERKEGQAQSLNVVYPNPFNPMVFDVFGTLKSSCFELPGYSEMSTQGRKEQSITSGVAIRTVNDMQDERHLVRARAYEQLFVELGKLDLQVMQEMVEAGEKPSVTLHNDGLLETIDWTEIGLRQDQFEVTIQASSATEDTIAARRQTVEDLTRMGYLDPSVSEQVLTAPNPDIEALTKRESAQRRYMDKLIAKFSRYRPKKDKKGDVFRAPDPLFNLVDSVKQMTDGYIVALERDAPDDVLQLFRDYIRMAGEMLKPKPAPAPTQPQPGAGGPPPGMPMPAPMMGAPPMAPPGPPQLAA